MLKALSIYGSDHCAHLAAPDIALGRCLARLLPEDTFDEQPVSGGGRLLVADLRLDNRDELIAHLSLPGDLARGTADSGILFAALERWGEAALDRLIGDYAFAWWDEIRRQLLLARDPLGMRPLHFHASPRFFAFASMPSGLHALPEVPCAPDLRRIALRAAQAGPGASKCFFEGIGILPAGHVLLVTPGRHVARRYWQPRRQLLRFKRSEEYEEAFRDVFDRAVASCLRGAENIAADLSGGLDSTAVTATAARLQAANGRRVVAFTAAPRLGYDGPELPGRFGDESSHAAAVAALYGNIDHVVMRPDGRGPLDDLDRAAYLYAHPILNLCNMVWVHSICDAIKARGLKVHLVGERGNATISYSGHELFPEMIGQGRLFHWLREASAYVDRGWGNPMNVLNRSLSPWLPGSILSGIPRSNRHKGANGVTSSPRDSWTYRIQWLARFDRGNTTKGVLAGWGIDRRDPAADRRVVEFCLSVPVEQFFRDGVPASLLRRAMADRLPSLVLEERRKGLQALDWHEALTASRDKVIDELNLLTACEPVAQRFDLARLHKAVDTWPTTGWERPETVQLYRFALLRTISAGHFVRTVLNGNR
jgi:asparagine synthase (glutamine-hydrolysing)